MAIRKVCNSWEPLALSLSLEDNFALYFWLRQTVTLKLAPPCETNTSSDLAISIN